MKEKEDATLEGFKNFLAEQFKPQSVTTYLFLIEHFLWVVKDPKHASYLDLINYFSKLEKDPNTSLYAVKHYYNYLLESGAISNNPIQKLTFRKKKKPIQFQDLFDAKELDYLLNRTSRYAVLNYRNKAILSLLIYQGLTSENIVKIRKFDIDLAEGEIYLMQGTRSVQRVITLNEAQIGYFSNFLQNERPQLDRFNQRSLFLNKLGDPISVNGIFRMVKPLNHFFPDRVLNPKIIRQSVTRNLSQSDKLNLVRIQQVTGHKRISSILNYRSEDMMEMRTTLLKFHPMDQF